MLYLIAYSFLVFLMFLFALSLFVYTLFSVIAQLAGSPYVPTKQKEIEFILEKANLKKNQLFLELGSGDGRVVRTAVYRYQVKGVGVEIHPLLWLYSKLLVQIQGLKKISFKRENFFKTDLKNADVVFLFLMPNTLKRLKERLVKTGKKNVLIISHGFKIEAWDNYLQDTINHTPFPTYFYRLKT